MSFSVRDPLNTRYRNIARVKNTVAMIYGNAMGTSVLMNIGEDMVNTIIRNIIGCFHFFERRIVSIMRKDAMATAEGRAEKKIIA